MRTSFALPLVAAIALAACSGGEEAGGDIAAEEVAASAGEMVRPQPGQYRSTVELVDIQIPGMGDSEVAQMRSMMEGVLNQGSEYCLTPEDAANGWEQVVNEITESECTFQKFEASGNRLEVEARCPGEGGQMATIKLDGTVSETQSSVTMVAEQSAPEIPGDGIVRMTMKVDSSRIGECAS